MKVVLDETTTRTARVRVTREQILAWLRRDLREANVSEESGLLPPTSAEVFVDVSGGGDWSNAQLTLDDDKQVVRVVWVEHNHARTEVPCDE